VRVAVALVHYPCLDKHGGIYTTSITNMDVHDIARASTTYGVGAFYVVTPVTAQQDMARAIIAYWEGERGQKRNPDRTTAMTLVHVVGSFEEAIEAETKAIGQRPTVVATSAKPQGAVTTQDFRARNEDCLILFGTGHGLAPNVIAAADVVLAPLLGRNPDYNHLSVRSAVAIYLDRLLG
jgi:tRNA (guanine37-N1)-methyltransferase